MARRPTQSGFAPVSLHVIPGKGVSRGGRDGGDGGEIEEEKTSIDPGPPRSTDDGWDDSGTSVDDQGSIETTARGDVGHSTVDEPTVEDQARPLPPLSLVPPLPKPAAPRVLVAKLVVIGGNDTGRDFALDAARPLTVGRAIDNDVVLTDIAVSRKHLDLAFDGEFWVMRDRGSGNGTLVNERIEDGSCRLQHGDRVEIGNTIFRFEHPGAVAPAPTIGWGQNDEDEASTVAGRSLRAELGPIAKGPDGVATVPVGKQHRATAKDGAIDRRAVLPAPPTPARARTPSSTQPPHAAGERLVLPVAPPGSTPATANELRMRPSSVIDSAVPDSMMSGRHLTTTARVEPRTFSASASAYPFVIRPPARARQAATAAAVALAIIGIGLIAKVTSKDDATTAAIAPKQARIATPVIEPIPTTPVPVPVPVPVPAPKVESPKIEPKIEPKAIAPTPPPPAPAPAPQAAPKAESLKVEQQPRPQPAPKIQQPRPQRPPKVVAVAPTPKPKQPPPAPKPRQTPPKISTSPPPRTETPRPKQPPADTAPAKATPKSLTAARKRAAQQYADGDFRAAAATLREAADAGDPNEVMPLRSLAGEYEMVGEAMAQGAAAAARPVEAFAAYSRALQADRRAGGAQGAEIRDKLGELAPKAAASYMAKSNYEAAKRAADSASDFGEGGNPLVQQVRASLEKKSAEFLATAQKMMASQPEDAKGLLRRIMKMVAPDSPNYQKAYALLNARPRPRDDDE